MLVKNDTQVDLKRDRVKETHAMRLYTFGLRKSLLPPIPTLSRLRQGYGGQALPLKGMGPEREVN